MLNQPAPHTLLVPTPRNRIPRLAIVVAREFLKVVATERLARDGVDEFLLGGPGEKFGVGPGGPDVGRGVVVCSHAHLTARQPTAHPHPPKRERGRKKRTVLLDQPDKIIPLGVLLILDLVLVQIRTQHALVPSRVSLVPELPVAARDQVAESAASRRSARGVGTRGEERGDELGGGLGLVGLDQTTGFEPATDGRVGPVLVRCAGARRMSRSVAQVRD